jgi:hypothetical protein
MALTLKVFPEEYSILRLNPDEPLPDWIRQDKFLAITRTPDELSVVAVQNNDIPGEIKVSKNWRMIMIMGPLDFGMVGIIAGITAVLAKKKIPVFVISTFDTDYFLVKSEKLDETIATLEQEQYIFV